MKLTTKPHLIPRPRIVELHPYSPTRLHGIGCFISLLLLLFLLAAAAIDCIGYVASGIRLV
jgi:hypothetical protein